MPIGQTPTLQANPALSQLVRETDPLLQENLPPTASALWDLRPDSHPLLVLALSDLFGYTAGRFDPDELPNQGLLRRRFYDLVGELVYSVRRTRIEIRDAFASSEQIASFQGCVNAIPDIARKRLRLFNNIRMLPDRPGSFLITDFAIEVDEDVADNVREAVRASGFNLRDDPLLQRHGIRERVRDLVTQHRRDPHQTPRHAICFNETDPSDLHLLEITDRAPSLGDGSIEGVGFVAGDTIPGARSIILYLTTPNDLRLALRSNPSHPAIRSLRSHQCWFVYPEDDGASFYRDFPEFGAARP
jgi:hypothetical protein